MNPHANTLIASQRSALLNRQSIGVRASSKMGSTAIDVPHKPPAYGVGARRILIFSLSYYPFVGGAEIAIKEITDRIDPKQISFDMITLRYDNTLPKIETIGNVTVYRVGFTKKTPTANELVRFPMYFAKVLYPLLAFVKAVSLYRKCRYDLFWAMMSYMGFPIVFFRLFYKKVPYILTLQEGDPIPTIKGRFPIRIVYPFFKMVFKGAQTVQVISTYLGDFARSMGFEGPLVVIPNGVDIDRFSKSSTEPPNTLKTSHGKKEGGIYLITASRLVKKNATDDVIRALMYLPEHIHFLILGTGPDEEKLKRMVKEEGIEERVHFLGYVDNQEIPEYLHQSDIFIRPSLSEGMGISFVEAMAAGIPVIATQVGGITDFLFDPDRNPTKKPTGRVVNPRDPEEIAKQVQNYLNNPQKTKEIITNAKNLVLEKYDWDIIAKNMYEKVFKKALL